MKAETILTPVQQAAADRLLESLDVGRVVVLRGAPGSGKTTILETVRAARGGVLLGAREFMDVLKTQATSAIEESFLRMLEDAILKHDLVIVDDLHLLSNIVDARDYPRSYLLDAALTAILGDAGILGCKLVFAVEDEAPWPIQRRAYVTAIAEFASADYECICRAYLPAPAAAVLDYERIHRFSPCLSAHQLRNAAVWLARHQDLDTAAFTEYLRSQDMTSNVEIQEVPPVDWKDLKGVDDVIRALEAKIALPFENDALASELHLKPKRGVLLAGPPGTGKTTIGRALAHRLKSKFFLIDGTMVAGTGDFYCQVREVFDAARRNAPSIIFIDDTDVIFEGDGDPGLYRYLLTMLDGLESASAGRVCVMMTAMNVAALPAAMLRSGRVELWLETRLPDAGAREQILRERLAAVPGAIGAADALQLATATNGLTGADLNAVVEDAKLLFAHDVSRSAAPRPAEAYFLDAIAELRANRRSYARCKPPRLTDAPKIGF